MIAQGELPATPNLKSEYTIVDLRNALDEVATVDDAEAVDILLQFTKLLGWRERGNKALEPFRAAGNKSTDARVTLLHLPSDPLLTAYRDELADLFIVSAVELLPGAAEDVRIELHVGPRCERCRKHYDHLAADPNDVCERCAEALRAIHG